MRGSTTEDALANDVMIEVKNLSKWYGGFRALDKVSFDVRRGEVVGFLGPNGAGKSTTMRILTCFLSATSGVARVHGRDIFEDSVTVRRLLGYLPQRAPLYGEMSVWGYLQFCAEMRGLDNSTFRARMKRIVEICGLAKVLGKDIRQLSHGYRQRVGLGQALVHDPPILILDEPTSDLDPNEKAEVIRYIQEIGKNRTVLLSTHNLNEVEAACARAIIVSKGRVVADGALDDIRAKSGRVRYIVTIDEKRTLGEGSRGAPTATEVEGALRNVPGILSAKELPTDDRAHTFELKGALGEDLRAELYQLAVAHGWLMLELRRETQTLEDVFKKLTRGDERADRGLLNVEPTDEEDEGEDDDDDDDDDAGAAAAPPAFSPTKDSTVARNAKSSPKDEEEDDDEDEEEDDGEEEDDDESDTEDDDDSEDDDDEDEDEDEDEEEEPPAKKGSAEKARASKKD
ncbi:MAG: ATP-binding cassette domain-containing protein [Polyangiaceae bacterium]